MNIGIASSSGCDMPWSSRLTTTLERRRGREREVAQRRDAEREADRHADDDRDADDQHEEDEQVEVADRREPGRRAARARRRCSADRGERWPQRDERSPRVAAACSSDRDQHQHHAELDAERRASSPARRGWAASRTTRPRRSRSAGLQQQRRARRRCTRARATRRHGLRPRAARRAASAPKAMCSPRRSAITAPSMPSQRKTLPASSSDQTIGRWNA